MNQQAFIALYRAELIKRYPWAQDAAKLDKFMASCTETVSTVRTTWNHDGEAVTAAWRGIGGKGKPTLKALRALPAQVVAP